MKNLHFCDLSIFSMNACLPSKGCISVPFLLAHEEFQWVSPTNYCHSLPWKTWTCKYWLRIELYVKHWINKNILGFFISNFEIIPNYRKGARIGWRTQESFSSRFTEVNILPQLLCHSLIRHFPERFENISHRHHSPLPSKYLGIYFLRQG